MLKAEGLAYRHPGSPVLLKFPDIQAEQGAQLLLRGPSGSGKSTLMALMAGLLRLQQGRLQLAGAELATLMKPSNPSNAVRPMHPREADAWRGRMLGIVPQRLHLSAGLSLRDNLRLVFFAQGQRTDEPRIDEMLRRLELTAQQHQKPSQLSAGQAQRGALARALLNRPRVLLADEPTANLDDDAARVALALMAELARESDATLVLATHDSRVVQALPDARCWTLELPA